MTHRYADMDMHDALYKVARKYPGGIPALAHRMEMSENVLRNKLSPGIATHHAAWQEVSEILEFLNEAKVEDAMLPLHAFNWQHGMVALPVAHAAHLTDQELNDSVMKVMKVDGDLAHDISEALANDGEIDDDEFDKIERDFKEAFAALAEWRERVIARHEAYVAKKKSRVA